MQVNNKLGKTLASIGLSLALLASPTAALAEGFRGSAITEGNDDGVALATIVTVEYGAAWDYGSVAYVYAWSNLTSTLHYHSSTVVGGQTSSTSGVTSPGVTSYASLWAALSSFAVYYNIW